MTRHVKKRREEIGAAPDQLIFLGQPKIDQVLLRVIAYNPEQLDEVQLDTVKEVLSFVREDAVCWFNIDGLHNTALMKEIASAFDLDLLLLAEVMNTSSRPKVIDYKNCLYLSLKMMRHVADTNTNISENISLIITETAVLSFQEQKGDVFEPIRERVRNPKKRIRTLGTDFLAFAIHDIIVDNYIYIVELLGEKIEALEEVLLTQPNASLIESINAYKKELNFMRKNIKPARDMITSLVKMDTEFIDKKNAVHFLELQNNINHAQESSDSYREILSDQLNIYHTTMSTKLNDIMKFLTVFSVVFIPLTFIAGIYGTNFDVLPELHYQYSYFIMLGVMLVVALGMLIYFKKKKWF